MRQQKIGCVANIFKFHTISTNPLPIKIAKLPVNLYNSIQNILTNKLPNTTKAVLTNSNKVYPFFVEKQQLSFNLNQHYICGYAISGNSGIDSQIVNSKKPQNIFHRTIHDVETIPLHFAFDLNPNKFNVILLTQTLGLSSITRPLVNAILRELREIYKIHGYSVEQENITLRSSYIQKYLSNGKIKNITATDFSLSPNKTSNSAKQARCELGIFPLPKKHFLSPNVTKFIITQDKTGLLGEIKNLTGIDLYDFEKLKCSIKMGETLRIIDILSPDNTQLRFDLSHITRQKNSCHPDLTTLLNEEKRLIQELRQYIV